MHTGRCLNATVVLTLWTLGGFVNAAERAPADVKPLPATQPLTWTDDIASRMVDGADRFLLSEIEKSIERRPSYWNRDISSAAKYDASIEPNRNRLRHILGVRDPRETFDSPQLLGTVAEPALVGQGAGFKAFAVRWPAFGDVYGEGMLLVPDRKPVADVIAIPDADQTPEMLAGLAEGVPAHSQFARRLAAGGCRVLVPVLIHRGASHRKISDREFLYRSAYELGRHIIGYEVQKVLSGVDWFSKEAGPAPAKIGVIGWGEGGMLALLAGALDPRIDAVCVSGYFDSRQNVWQEPIYRNVFGLLEQFGDAELAAMIAPRRLVVEAARGPELVRTARHGRRPRPVGDTAVGRRPPRGRPRPPVAQGPRSTGTDRSGRKRRWRRASTVPITRSRRFSMPLGRICGPCRRTERRKCWASCRTPRPASAGRCTRIDRHSQSLLLESPSARQKYFSKLDTRTPEAFKKSVESYRESFYNDVIGRFDGRPLPFNVRTRKSYEGEKWTGYEVVLDVFPDVFAYGVLLVPKDLKPGQRRPVVVCQHGLEGRPTDVFLGNNPAYHDYAARLADRGFVTFAPQNPYLLRRPLPHAPAKGQPHQEDALLDHRAATSADRRLVGHPAVRRSAADRLLWAVVRRQDGDASAAPGDQLLPVDLFGPTSTSGLGRTPRPACRSVMFGPANTRYTNSTWEARSIMPRWPP